MKSAIENKGISLNLFLFLFGIYFLSAQGTNIDSVDQQKVRFATTKAMIEKGDLAIQEGTGVKGKDGKDYSWYGIGQPLLAIPFYIAGRTVGGDEGAKGFVSMINLFVVTISGVIVFMFIANIGYSKKAALIVTVFYSLGTLAWPQSKHPFDHPVEMLFVLVSVFQAHAFVKSGNRRHLILSSVSLGFAFITKEYAVLMLFPLFCLLALSNKKKRLTVGDCTVYLLFFLPFVLIYLLYNYLRFGTPFYTGMMIISQKEGVNLFSTPFITGVTGLLLSPGKGFFYYSPICILYFFSIKGFYEKNRALSLCFISIILSYLILLSNYGNWFGGWAWGPRYLLVITPFLMIPVANLIEILLLNRKVVVRSAVLFLFVVSFVVQLIGVSVDFNRYYISLQVKDGIRFKHVGGKDTPPSIEAPLETNFEWDKFPITYQAASAIRIWQGLKDYKVVNNDTGKALSIQEAFKYFIRYNVFDFWWIYALYTGIPLYIILLELSLLGFIIVFSWFRILAMLNR